MSFAIASEASSLIGFIVPLLCMFLSLFLPWFRVCRFVGFLVLSRLSLVSVGTIVVIYSVIAFRILEQVR